MEDLVQTLINAALLVLLGSALTYAMRDKFRQQEKTIAAQIDALRSEMTGHHAKSDVQIVALQAQIDALSASMDRQFASVRSDLTQVALAVGAQPRPQAG